MHRNPDSALKLGQARGVALCAAASSGAGVHRICPARHQAGGDRLRRGRQAAGGADGAARCCSCECAGRRCRRRAGGGALSRADAAPWVARRRRDAAAAHGAAVPAAALAATDAAECARGSPDHEARGHAMIGSLAGLLAYRSPPHLLLEVGGVGYEVEAPMSTFYALPAVGRAHAAADASGGARGCARAVRVCDRAERALFRSLLKIRASGRASALAILSGVSAAAFAQAVREQDAAALMRIPGVGRKTAERLIVEMRDRLAGDARAGVECAARVRRRRLSPVPRPRLRGARVASATSPGGHATAEGRRSERPTACRPKS